MNQVRLLVAVLLATLLCSHAAAHAQETPDIDALLKWQDQLVLTRYQQSYVTDKRYDPLLARIGARLNPHLGELYRSSRPVRYYVFIGRMGFNAQTWNDIIIFDSLLLDTMRHLANGIAVYGTTDCEYVHTLAQYVAQVDAACRSGQLVLNLTNPTNPYLLPNLWGLTPEQKARADALFEEMVASWMAHEGSHAFLQHTRERMQAQAQAQALTALWRQRGEAPPEKVRQYINSYLSYDTSRQKEREADEYGIRLTLKAGYGVDGLIYTFEFAQMLEELTGESNIVNRTHPTPLERIALARQIAAEEHR